MNIIIRNFIILFLISSIYSCTQVIDTGNTSGSSSSGNNNGSGYSDPSKPSYTPPSSTGDTVNGGTTSTGSTTSTTKVDSLVITATSLTPCVSNNELISLSLSGKNIPTNVTYEWYFGDGNSIKPAPDTVTNVFKYPGSYTIIAKIDSGTKILGTCTQVIKVAGTASAVKASFSSSLIKTTASAITYAFSSYSTPSANISTIFWNFGDGYGDNTNYTYVQHPFTIQQNATTYPVSLIVNSKGGCADTLTKQIIIPGGGSTVVNPSSSFTYSSTSPCSPNTEVFTFTGTTTNVSSNAIYSWDLGDGNRRTGNPIVYSYASGGTYTVNMNVIAGGSQVAQSTQSIKAVGQDVTPTANIYYQPVTNTVNQFIFQSTSTVTNGKIVSDVWNFGDKITSVLSTSPHTFTQLTTPVTYTVQLTSKSDAGCTGTTYTQVTIPAK